MKESTTAANVSVSQLTVNGHNWQPFTLTHVRPEEFQVAATAKIVEFSRKQKFSMLMNEDSISNIVTGTSIAGMQDI